MAVALVTVAGSGIGKGASLALAAEKYCVGVVGYTEREMPPPLNNSSRWRGSLCLAADISDETQMVKAVDDLVRHFGRLDVFVANAGITGVWAPINDLKLEEWNRTIAANLTGAFLTIQATVPHLKQLATVRSESSSINGTRTFTTPGATAYTATRAGQVAMVQQLALELARHHIRINAVCPGEIDTNIEANTQLSSEHETAITIAWPEGQVPITGGRPGKSEDVADIIVFLASDKSRTLPARQSGSMVDRDCCDEF